MKDGEEMLLDSETKNFVFLIMISISKKTTEIVSNIYETCRHSGAKT